MGIEFRLLKTSLFSQCRQERAPRQTIYYRGIEEAKINNINYILKGSGHRKWKNLGMRVVFDVIWHVIASII